MSDASASGGAHNDVFSYIVSDGHGGTASAMLTITIDPHSGPNSIGPAAANDFNGDGKADILWRHDSGLVGLWEMNGAQVATSHAFSGAPNDWHLLAGNFEAV